MRVAHLVREADGESSHPGSSTHGRGFGFLLFRKTKTISTTCFIINLLPK